MARDGGEEARSRQLYEEGKRGLAAQFDAERELIRHDTEEGNYYITRGTIAYARCLLHDAGPGDEDCALAARMIERVLAVQERQPGNIHAGNFPWMVEDGYVADLNAVEFVLQQLCHLLLESGEKLPASTRAAIHEAMHLGLSEVARLDVGVEYTNICLLDCHNSILGGQLLGAPAWTERGSRKLDRWAAYTAASGAPREYNSPTYCGVDLTALAALAEHAADPAVQLQALLLEERLWLHVATHYHAPTAQLAGPHSRAYHNDVTGGRGSLKTVLYQVLGDERLMRRTPFYALRQEPGQGDVEVALTTYHCPDAVRALLTDPAHRLFAVRETADAAARLDLSTALTPDWALGVASRSYGVQADNLLLQYRKEAEPGFGVAYTRFILNDRRLGGAYHATDRTRSNNIADVGAFCGLHHHNKAIGVYGLTPQHEDVSSIKLDVFFAGRAGLGRVLVGDRPVEELPVELPSGVPLIVEDGAVYVGVLPLRHSNLGRGAPVRLEEDGGDLVLSTVLYEGPPKRFWEYAALSGPFYRGNVECGLVVEVATREEFPSAESFAAFLAAARLLDVTLDGERTIRYRSGGDDLTLRYRLSDMEIVERQINGAPLVPAPLDARTAAQRHDGPLLLGGHRLEAPRDQAANWLYTSPDGGTVVASRGTRVPGPWEFRLAGGRRVASEALGLARVRYAAGDGRLDVELAGSPADLTLRGWRERPAIAINGADAGERVRETAPGEWLVAGD